MDTKFRNFGLVAIIVVFVGFLAFMLWTPDHKTRDERKCDKIPGAHYLRTTGGGACLAPGVTVDLEK